MIYTGVFSIIALILNILATRKLLRSKRLLDKTKRIHIVLVWLIPFLWSILVLQFSDNPPEKGKKLKGPGYMDSGFGGYY
jgi:hypothetical protein